MERFVAKGRITIVQSHRAKSVEYDGVVMANTLPEAVRQLANHLSIPSAEALRFFQGRANASKVAEKKAIEET